MSGGSKSGSRQGGAKSGASKSAREGGTSRMYIPSSESDSNVISLDERREKERKASARAKRAARKRRRKRIAITTVVIAVLLAVGAGLYFLLIIDTVRIDGCSEYSEEWVRDIAEIEVGTHMWLADTDGAEKRIGNEPLLEFVSVGREYPSTLVITVRERLPFASIHNADTAVIIDSRGHILSISSASADNGEIIVSGLGSGGYQVNMNIMDSGNLRASALVAILGDIDDFGLSSRIRVLDVANSLSVTMTATSGITVVVGEAAELDVKFAHLSEVLDRLEADGVTSGTLYLSATGDPVYSPGTAMPIDHGDPDADPDAPVVEPTPAVPEP